MVAWAGSRRGRCSSRRRFPEHGSPNSVLRDGHRGTGSVPCIRHFQNGAHVNGNSSFTHRTAGVISVEAVEAPEVVTSDWIDDQLTDTYERWGLRPGLLAELAGIKERRWWPEGVTFDQAAAMAGRQAIEVSGIDPNRIGMMISTSVSRHHLEPSVACAIHSHLGLPTSCIN